MLILFEVFFVFRFFLGSQPLKESKIDTSKGHCENSDIDDEVGIVSDVRHPANLPLFSYFLTIL